MKEQVLIILPIKASKESRIPFKEMRSLAGRYMFLYVLDEAIKANIKSKKILISSCSNEVGKVFFGYIKPLFLPSFDSVNYNLPPDLNYSVRQEYLCEDPYQIADVCIYEIDEFEKRKKSTITTIIILQVDNPFILAEDIEDCYKTFIENNRCAVTTVVKEVPSESSYFGMIKTGLKLKPICGNSIKKLFKSNFPESYKITGGVTVIDKQRLLDEGIQYIDNMIGYEIPMERAINIDTPYDFEIAEYFMKKRLQSKGRKPRL